MSPKLLVLSLLLVLSGLAGAQTPTPSAKAAEDAAKLEKDAVEFLRDTSNDVARLRTLENRISFNAELASLMWFHDDKEARAMYGGVINDFKQLLQQFDMQMNSVEVPDDDDYASGGIFGGGGKNKVERKFRIAMAVRQQIAMSLAEHAPDLAYNFFYDSLNLISNPKFKKETEQSDKNFEYRLIKQIAETDAAKAAEYGKESIKGGLDAQHIDLLKKIYAKDADKGIDFGAAIFSRMSSDKSSVKSSGFYSSLLAFGAENLAASKKPGAKKPVYEQNDLRDIAEQFAQYLLDDANKDSQYMASTYAAQIDKYAPGRGAQIKAKYKTKNPTSLGNANASAKVAELSTAPMSNSNAAPAVDPGREAREAKAKAEQEMMNQVKDLGTKPLPKEERDKIVAQARKIIAGTPGKEKKITALSMLAAQVAHAGDKELADQIMNDADRLVNPQPKNYQDFLFSWMLATGYAETNPDKAFPLLESTILRANDTLSAFIKVAEFIDINDELIEDGEVQVGMFGGEMIRGVTGELGLASGMISSLAKADFGKTKNLTNTFDRTEIRVLAKMMVLRAVLDKRTQKEMADEMQMDKEETDTAPPDDPTRR
ncbi:hypothetical protein BH10ACI3_BH10ACI3_21640 [soil metagenome]